MSFDSTLLSPVLFSFLHLLLSLSCPFSAYWTILWAFPTKFFNNVREEVGFFVWLLFHSKEKLVVRWYERMLPYAAMPLNTLLLLFLFFLLFLFIKKKSLDLVSIKQTGGGTILARPSLM